MRRRSGRNWMLMEEAQQTPKDPFGDLVAATFERRTFLLDHEDDDSLLAVKPKLSDEVRLEQVFSPKDGGWKQDDLTLRMLKGFNPFLGVQPAVTEFLIDCDGARTLREVIETFSAKMDAPRAQVQRECVQVVRKLIERGFLLC